MTKISFILCALPLLAQVQARGPYHGHQVSQRSFLPYDLQPRDLGDVDFDGFEILGRALQRRAPTGKASKPPSFLNVGKSSVAAPVTTNANSKNGKNTRLPSAEKKLEHVEQSQVSTMHKIMNPSETLAGGEHAYYKQKLRNEFGSSYKQKYEAQRDAEIAKKNDRTKNYSAQQAENRKVLGENIKNAGDAVHVASEGLGVVKNILKPFKKRDIEDMLEARDLEIIEDMLIARDLAWFDNEDELLG